MLATPFLAGSNCSFSFSTGDSDPSPGDPNEKAVVAMQGHLVGPAVQGISYKSGSLSGLTGENGEFDYEEGGTVIFFIGDIILSGEIKGSDLLSPIDLVDDGNADHPAVVNIARLLQSLDATPGDGIITIPPSVAQAAVVTNESIYSSLQSLDFSDQQSFVNAASALVAVLTRDYPFTVTLVDADTAREQMLDSLEVWNIQQATTAGSD